MTGSSTECGAVRFSVLGPVRAWRDGTELDLGPPQQRATLAVLLVRAKRPVGLAEITTVLWGIEPPVSAANVVHRHIGMLRRLLEPGLPNRAEGNRLVRVGGGYRLRVTTEDIDLLRFRDLRDRAREAERDGVPVRAVERLDEALALWQGPVAAGISAAVRGHRVFAALEREYLAVARDAADLALRHGVSRRILGSLERCAARHPLDQQIQSRLALALAATGHQAEALETCRLARIRLAEERGVSSGPELRAAHQRILEGDVTAGPAGGGARTLSGPPRQLPSLATDLSGREAEADRLTALADPARPGVRSLAVGAVTGPAGVGKTALALHVAHRLAPRFPDGQLHLPLRGSDPNAAPLTPLEAVGRLIRSLGFPPPRIPSDLDTRTALLRSLLAGKRVLLLLDDALDEEQVRPLLPGGADCLVLVTSRHRLTGLVAGEGACRVVLDADALEPARAAQ
ncbi:BTAD domain-containing putative transcriptional regulator [Streptomyces antibioticus]|uniref:AfsR/SARP family transcriptional regulator n=1 Tax=Streptomyces antibioticus TaxID=1890 RepID=UPI0037158595